MQNFTVSPIVSESTKKSVDFNPCPRITYFLKTFTWISAVLSERPFTCTFYIILIEMIAVVEITKIWKIKHKDT